VSTAGGCPDADRLRSLFEHSRELSFGVEEELMVLDAQTLDLAPRAPELLAKIGWGEAIKLELPASQLEIVTPPREEIPAIVADLGAGRARLRQAVAGRVKLLAAGAHPFAAPEGVLNREPRHERLEREYGRVARRQLVCGLHVHVGLRGAARVLAVYNAMRSHLPEIAALGANAPFRGGRDSGMASVRPLISGLLPRQGVPPAYASWEELASDLEWGERAGRLEGHRGWWWELRIHPQLGTLEVRVPDAQSTVADAAALVTTVCALVQRLAAAYDADELPGAVPAWRIGENRWSAARHGVDGTMLDLHSGRARPTRERLHELLEELRPFASRLGGDRHLDRAHELAERNGADRQREIAADSGFVELLATLDRMFDAA
jgi:glutamate---cysteine ligase / carboxylate-amine ligase